MLDRLQQVGVLVNRRNGRLIRYFVRQSFDEITTRVAKCLADNHGDRNGRFWVDKEKKTVTMAFGESSENKYLTRPF